MRMILAALFFITASHCLSSEGTPLIEDELTTWNPRYLRKGQPNSCLTPSPKPKTVTSPISSHVEIGGNYTYAHVSPSGHSSTQGSLGGIHALYEFKTPNRIYGALRGAWWQGNTDSSGESRFIVAVDAQERIGYTWGSLRKGRMFSLFSGLGYRRYAEKVKQSGSSVKFYYNELYIPLGFLLKGRINSVLSMGFNFQWMPQVYPTLTIVPLDGARWILNNKIANFRAELPFIMCVSRKNHLSLTLQPFFEFWQDGHTSARTKLGTTLNVPGNTYLFGGIDLNLRYSF